MPATETASDPSPVPLAMSLGSKLKDARIALGLSRADVAARLDVKPKTIENWELNAAEPSLKMVKKLSQLLEVPLVELMDEVEGIEGAVEPVAQDRAASRVLQARRKLQEAAVLLGGTVVFGSRRLAPPDSGEEAEERRTASALEVLTATARDKGFRSRVIPKQLAAARQELSGTDYPELFESASRLGIDLVGLPDPSEDLENDDLKNAVAEIESYILADAIYGASWRALSVEGFERAADEMKRGIYKDDPDKSGGFINRKQWWSEDADQYAVRLRREVTPHLVFALENGQAVDLSKVAEEPSGGTLMFPARPKKQPKE